MISDRALRRLISFVRSMTELTELHIVNQELLEKYMGPLADSVRHLKRLKVLNLRQSELRTREVGPLVPLLAESTNI